MRLISRRAPFLSLLIICIVCWKGADAQTVDLRIAAWNIEADIDGVTAPLPGVPTVLMGLGEENVNGIQKAPDILALEETTSNSVTVQPIANDLDADYPGSNWQIGPSGATEGGVVDDGNGPNTITYNANTVTLIGSEGVGTPLGSTNGEYRQPMRYEFQPVGGTAANDFYVYVNHSKSGSGTTNALYRSEEAAIIRADEATLPANASVLYVGDLNTSTTTVGDNLYVFTQTGQGQAYDPAGFSSSYAYYSESDTYLEYRDDYELMTQNVLNDTGGLNYVSGSFHVFGNNGTTPYGQAANYSGNTALSGLTNPSQADVLYALTQASDHYPVEADYYVLLPEPGSGLIAGGVVVLLRLRRRRAA